MTRVAIITGASQGLGRALARELARRHYALVVDARRPDRLAEAERELGGLTDVTAIVGDVVDADHRRRLVDAAAELGPIDVLVNNASTLGASPLPALADIDLDVLRTTFETNVVAPLALVPARRATPGAERHDREHHVRRGRRGVSHLGRLRRDARRRSSTPVACWPSSTPTCACWSSTPATCAPRCTRTRSPARTSPTAPRPEDSVPGLVALIEGDQPSGRYSAREVA